MKDKFLFALSLVWSVACSVVLTILLSIPLFSLDIGWEHLSTISGFSHSILMKNYAVLMRYLLNPFEAKLRMPNFPDSASALQHFSEVKMLFLFTIALVILLFPAIYKFMKNNLYLLFRRGIVMAMIVPIVLTILAAMIGFDTFFITFHEILFRDNTWLFDPTTDPIINVLTDNFFMYTFIISAIIYEMILFVMLKSKNLLIRRKNAAGKTSI